MATEKMNWKPVPLAMDDALKREVEAVAKAINQKQASVMREAIRKGLPLVKAGGAADVIALDGELSKEIDHFCSQTKCSRPRILIDAIWRGFPMLKAGGVVEALELDKSALDAIDLVGTAWHKDRIGIIRLLAGLLRDVVVKGPKSSKKKSSK